MKKLAFVAAAALAGSCFADGIASANIVGYMQNDLTNGFSIIVSPFAAINATQTIDIQDLVPVDSTGAKLGKSSFQIQIKKPNGATGKSFIYLVKGEAGGDVDINGWYEDDGETVATKTFAIGESFLFCSNVKGATLTYNGEVISKALELPLINGFQLLGNPRATKINIQDLVPVNAEGQLVGKSTFQLQVKAANGYTKKSYLYLVKGEAGGDVDINGWYEDDGETVATIDFAPGDGFLFVSAVTGGKLLLSKQDL